MAPADSARFLSVGACRVELAGKPKRVSALRFGYSCVARENGEHKLRPPA
jgi:hypothetical protein